MDREKHPWKCANANCTCHNAKELFKKALEKMDFEGMARVWHEGNIQWHANEWKEFIAQERARVLNETRAMVEGMRAGDVDKVSEDEMRDIAFNLANQNLVFGYNLALADVLEKL